MWYAGLFNLFQTDLVDVGAVIYLQLRPWVLVYHGKIEICLVFGNRLVIFKVQY